MDARTDVDLAHRGVPRRDKITSVVLCRDCCCGSEAKHPDFDHEAQLRRISKAASSIGARFKVASCLDECERSNNVLVRQRHDGKSEAILIGQLLDRELTEALCEWLEGPAGVDLPEALAERRYARRATRPTLAARYAAGLEDSLTCPTSTPAPTSPEPA